MRQSLSRRAFLRHAGMAAASAAAFPKRMGAAQHMMAGRPSSIPMLRAASLERFVDPLPIPPVAQPAATRGVPSHVLQYRIPMRPVESRVHRDLQPTTFWSFGSTFPGPTVEARRGQAISIEWLNQLPQSHFLPIDRTIHGAGPDVPDVRAVVHVHGARVRPEDDGYPDRWFVPGASATCHYPNDQDASTLWYHDHTMGINRLNVYAGLMGLYLIRDDEEDGLNLPAGRRDIPLLICDRRLRVDGQLEYPTSGDPDAPWTDDVSGDAVLINGKLFPYLDVEARAYRFRIVNGSNGRFFTLSLSGGHTFHQIASDQGLLAAPVPLAELQLAPAERADVVVDFADCRGARIAVHNGLESIMDIRVAAATVPDDSVLPRVLRTVPRLQEASAVRTREHSLDEADDQLARPMMMLLNNTRWHAPVTEQPELGTTEVWSLVNVTDDSHPIHLHLVRFQILDRRNFDPFVYRAEKRIVLTGPSIPPEPNEMGWKDTVRAHGGMVTRIIARFEGYPGRYMWHCHILEHGDNEMMRPFEIIDGAGAPG